MTKAIELFYTKASMHEIELYLWLLNNRLNLLAESIYDRHKGDICKTH